MVRIAYCDDGKTTLRMYSQVIGAEFQKHRHPVTIDMFQSSSELLKRMEEGVGYDAFFLDVNLSGRGGIELGLQLRKNLPETPILFVSAYDDCVFESLQANPFRFIRKTQFAKDLEEAVPALINEWNKNEKKIVVSANRSHYQLNPHKILYIECNDKTQRIVTKEQPIEIRYKLKELEDTLAEYGFLRIHKGFLVNAKYITCLKRNEVTLTTGEVLPLSKHRSKTIVREFGKLA